MNPMDREQQHYQQQVEDQNANDDEFGDFGGFEGADPIPDMPAPQAAASPWALLSSGAAAGRPDLLCAQNRFPTVLDPSDIAAAPVAISRNENLNNQAQAPPHPVQVDLFNGDFPNNAVQVNQARIAEGVLDGALNVAGAANFLGQQLPGQLPDIGLGINENRLFGQGNPIVEANNEDNVAELLVDPPAPEDDAQRDVQEREAEEDVVINEQIPPVEEVQHDRENQEERNALLEQIQRLTDQNESLNGELTSCQEELNRSQSRLQDIQTRHESDLAEIRKAGSESLAIVVEQYKEQMAVFMVEQQEQTKRHLLDAQTQNIKLFQEMLENQRIRQEEEQEKERLEVERRISQALEEGRQQQELQFKSFLQKEKERQDAEIKESIEVERKRCEEQLKVAIAKEQENIQSEIQSFQTSCTEQLNQEIETHKTALQNLRLEEKDLAKAQMSELCKEERESSKEAFQAAMAEACYNQSVIQEEQRKADARLRRAHYTSLDIFLESSRQQIALLLDADKRIGEDSESEKTSDRDKKS